MATHLSDTSLGRLRRQRHTITHLIWNLFENACFNRGIALECQSVEALHAGRGAVSTNLVRVLDSDNATLLSIVRLFVPSCGTPQRDTRNLALITSFCILVSDIGDLFH